MAKEQSAAPTSTSTSSTSPAPTGPAAPPAEKTKPLFKVLAAHYGLKVGDIVTEDRLNRAGVTLGFMLDRKFVEPAADADAQS